jgi:hypothetical protein
VQRGQKGKRGRGPIKGYDFHNACDRLVEKNAGREHPLYIEVMRESDRNVPLKYVGNRAYDGLSWYFGSVVQLRQSSS